MKKYITTAALLVAGSALVAAEELDAIWAQFDIDINDPPAEIDFSEVSLGNSFTLAIKLENWTVGDADQPIGWLITDDGPEIKNSAGTFGWGYTQNGAIGHATSFDSNGSAAGQGLDTDGIDSTPSYGKNQYVDTILFLTFDNGDTWLYEINKSGKAVAVSNSGPMNTSGVKGLYIVSDEHSGTMDFGIYSGVLTTEQIESLVSIPEPSMFGLLTGLCALAFVGVRRRK